MKVICTGSTYKIYENDLRAFDALPVGVYNVNFNEMSGFSLSSRQPIEIKEKLYGVHNEKADKVMHSFDRFERNLGVILSGAKGIGKSMFAKLLCVKANQRGLPVIVVDNYIPGIARYIESIEQEVVVLFDEFDKIFANGGRVQNEGKTPQTELLSLFDGLASGKKMFVITCNSLDRVSDYIVNRPGRFHYHFRFDYPTPAEICEYLADHLERQYHDQIDAVVSFASKIAINYDCLRSIAFELNLGLPFKEAIKDINILNVDHELYDLELLFEDGTSLRKKGYMMDLFADDGEYIAFDDKCGNNIIDVSFDKGDIVYNTMSGISAVHGDCIKKEWVEEEDGEGKRLKDLDISCLKIKRRLPRDVHYIA